MKTPDIVDLNKQFSFEQDGNYLRFKNGAGDIPVVEIHNEMASALVSLQGAHILSWIPAGQDEVIWVSEQATFAPGKSVRGGVPICWPWFGAHENDSSYPAHGFARIALWQVTEARQVSDGETQIKFVLDTRQLDSDIQQMWPAPTVAEYTLTVSNVLTLEIITRNESDQDITIGQALHTYFNVHNVANTSVTGLEAKDYLDKTDGFNRKTQYGPVVINSEVDRVYLDTPDDVIIDDNKRKITIKKQGSLSTVVWNPWVEVAEKMGDLGEQGYLKMLCVESANAADDTVHIKPAQSHKLTVTYTVS